jgi:SNF2 family DNA or RNA helicase
MTFMVLNIMGLKGSALVYSNYVVMEGLQIFKLYLKYFGFTKYRKDGKDGKDGKSGKDYFRYMEYHGGIDQTERRIVLEKFNVTENKDGSISKIIMISPAGAEGISLKNVRHVHIMEPYWQEVRIEQMIGRAIRQCSHSDLPMEEREVNVFRYKSVRDTKDKWTADQYVEDLARSKESWSNERSIC